MLRELDRNIWIAERPQCFWGLEVGTQALERILAWDFDRVVTGFYSTST